MDHKCKHALESRGDHPRLPELETLGAQAAL